MFIRTLVSSLSGMSTHNLLLATACLRRTHVAGCVASVFVVTLRLEFSSIALCFPRGVLYLWLWWLLCSGWFSFQWPSSWVDSIIFLFLGMCWLGWHVHADNSAVMAMILGGL